MNSREIFDRIDRERMARGWTRRQLSEKTYRSPSTLDVIHKYVMRGGGMNIETANSMLKPLGLELVVRKRREDTK